MITFNPGIQQQVGVRMAHLQNSSPGCKMSQNHLFERNTLFLLDISMLSILKDYSSGKCKLESDDGDVILELIV